MNTILDLTCVFSTLQETVWSLLKSQFKIIYRFNTLNVVRKLIPYVHRPLNYTEKSVTCSYC